MTPDKQQILEEIAKKERELDLLRDDLLMIQREERNRREELNQREFELLRDGRGSVSCREVKRRMDKSSGAISVNSVIEMPESHQPWRKD